jgi:cytochrome P450
MTALGELVRLEEPSFYDEVQFEVYDRMRREAPVFHYEPLDVLVLTTMADIRYVSTHPELFSSTGGLTLNQLRMARAGATAAFERFNQPAGELVITKDPPRQRQLRALMAPTLVPRSLDSFGDSIARFCRELLDPLEPGTTFDFVERIASRLPILVAALVLGVGPVDLDRMRGWVEALEDLTRVESADQLEAPGRRFDEMKAFLRAQLAAKRAAPGDDMISRFLTSALDGEPVPDAVVLSHVSTLMSNGGTTRLLLTSLAWHLAVRPEQVQLIRKEPALLDAAIEECLRLSPPARGFVRTATRDVELHGRTVRGGQRVYLLYVAANRDPEVFEEPALFDIRREQTTNHAAFGFGTHFCLGAGLARTEARELFRQLLSRPENLRIDGEPQSYPHVQLNGWQTLPVSLHR